MCWVVSFELGLDIIGWVTLVTGVNTWLMSGATSWDIRQRPINFYHECEKYEQIQLEDAC